MMIRVGRRGKFYTLNGVVVKPEDFWAIDGFKFANHIVAWATGGAFGESAQTHLDRARRYIEHMVIGLGCRRMRSAVELMFWSGPYFDLPADGPAPYNIPNVANTRALVDLHVGTGSKFSLPPLYKKVVRKYVLLARETGIVIEVPWIWTIKGKATKRTKHYPDPREVRHGGKGISAWNEHYMASRGVGGYLELLATKGDGEGDDRVDPGPLNLLHDFCNEYTVSADTFTKGQLRSMARRFKSRDAPSQQTILISEGSGFMDEYIPPLESKVGVEGYDGPCKHPPRSEEKDSQGRKRDWDETGTAMRRAWPTELIDANESQLMLTQAQRDYWVPRIPKWAGLGSTNMPKCIRMHENFIENEIYSTLHTFLGMDTYWPETEQTVVEDAVRTLTGGGGGPPPPPPSPPPTPPQPPQPPQPPSPPPPRPVDPRTRPYDRTVVHAYRIVLSTYDLDGYMVRDRKPDPGGREFYNTALERHYLGLHGEGVSLSVTEMYERMRESVEYKKLNPMPEGV